MEEKLELKDDKPIWLNKKVEEVFQELYDHYRAINNRNEYLSKEIAKVKEETYKDTKLAEMKKKYDEMSANYYRGFAITEEESKKITEWMNDVTKGEDFQTSTITDSFSGKKLTFQEP